MSATGFGAMSGRLALRAAPNASESTRPGPGTAVGCDRIADRLEKPASSTGVAQANDTLSSKEVRDLMRRWRHGDEADAADHLTEAKGYRSAPNVSESKRPGSLDTAVHCDRSPTPLATRQRPRESSLAITRRWRSKPAAIPAMRAATLRLTVASLGGMQ